VVIIIITIIIIIIIIGNTSEQKCHAKGSRKETKTQDCEVREKTNKM